VLLQTSKLQSDIAPLRSSEAFSLVAIAGPDGSQACSCSRIHCRRPAARAVRARSGPHRPRHRPRRYGRNTGAFDGMQRTLAGRHSQHFRDTLAIGIDALGMGPHRHRAVDELRNGADGPIEPCA